jgi:glycosyltransferase involved in cell wall biosynthesis
MKLFLDYELNTSGKGKMLKRLIPALGSIGVETRFKEKGCDVALGVSRWRTNIKIPKVIRVDGVHLKENDKNNWKNERIRKGIQKADAVIYQSKFAQTEVKKHLNLKDKKEFVIFNGANPDDYQESFNVKIDVISSAKWCHRNGWRKHKRIDTVIEVAKQMPDVDFYVAGRLHKKKKATENLTFLGLLEDNVLRKYLATAKVMLYPVKYDWCPNALVEAICAGCAGVVTSGHGGTELIRACGGKVANSVNEMVEAIEDLLVTPITVNKEPVHIDNIAKQYKEVFKSVL